MLRLKQWTDLDELSNTHLEATSGESFKGFFYMGIALYKNGNYENALRAYTQAELLNSEDAQL